MASKLTCIWQHDEFDKISPGERLRLTQSYSPQMWNILRELNRAKTDAEVKAAFKDADDLISSFYAAAVAAAGAPRIPGPKRLSQRRRSA